MGTISNHSGHFRAFKSLGLIIIEPFFLPTVEMNSQDDNVNEPTECQQEDFQ